jgi:gluconolactonase
MPSITHDAGLSAFVGAEDWQVVADGFGFTEGPVWLPHGSLLFSDIPNSRIHRLRDGEVTVFRAPSGQSNGLTLDPNMHVVACEHENRRVSIERDGAVSAIATHYEGKRLNSPNDVVVRSDGMIFFTDPPYGITEEQRELPHNGVYSLEPAGAPRLLIDDFDRPNGLAFSPDERVLYIADTERRHVRSFDVAADGTLAAGRVFAETVDDGRPDGMKVDRDGRLYVCARGVQVFGADGSLLGVIDCPQRPANCAWGDDGSMLYVTARTAVYRTPISVQGIAPHLRAG